MLVAAQLLEATALAGISLQKILATVVPWAPVVRPQVDSARFTGKAHSHPQPNQWY
jgi:hypothetical protein